MVERTYVVVSGPPASGKSRLAPALAVMLSVAADSPLCAVLESNFFGR